MNRSSSPSRGTGRKSCCPARRGGKSRFEATRRRSGAMKPSTATCGTSSARVLEIGMDGLVRGYLLPIAAAEALGDAIEHQLVGLEDLEGMLVDGVGGARQLRLRLLEAPLVIEPGGGSEQDQPQDDDGRKEELERPRRSGPALHRKSLHQCSGKL